MRRSQHYEDRVNRVLDYVSRHLDSELSLAAVSNVACFSPFHFHRIFQGITGETLNAHVRRVRLERAALLMRTFPEERITDIALRTGFAGAAEFSRAFKAHFGQTPSSWNRKSPLENSKICKAPEMLSFHTEEELERWRTENHVQVRRVGLNPFCYVYTRIFAPYGSTKIVDAYGSLREWLRQRGTGIREVAFVGMSLDDPSITPSENCRYDLGAAFPRKPGGLWSEIVQGQSAAIPGPQECEGQGFSRQEFAEQQVGAIHCVGDIFQEERAWHYLYRMWLPASDFAPADAPAMEIFRKLPEETGWETFDLEACLPVVPF